MTDKEMVATAIDYYCNLQRIKKANGNTENPVLDYEIKVAMVKLASFGINVKELTL